MLTVQENESTLSDIWQGIFDDVKWELGFDETITHDGAVAIAILDDILSDDKTTSMQESAILELRQTFGSAHLSVLPDHYHEIKDEISTRLKSAIDQDSRFRTIDWNTFIAFG